EGRLFVRRDDEAVGVAEGHARHRRVREGQWVSDAVVFGDGAALHRGNGLRPHRGHRRGLRRHREDGKLPAEAAVTGREPGSGIRDPQGSGIRDQGSGIRNDGRSGGPSGPPAAVGACPPRRFSAWRKRCARRGDPRDARVAALPSLIDAGNELRFIRRLNLARLPQRAHAWRIQAASAPTLRFTHAPTADSVAHPAIYRSRRDRGNVRAAMFRINCFAIVAALVLFACVASAQDMRPAEQVYKNIKVMTGVPASQIVEGMHVIKAALGVTCEHCHIQGQMDRDDLPAKNKARAMYLMMTEINRANFGGRQLVTCVTCHRGHATPANVPELPSPSITEETESRPQLPTVDEILAKYITALGGEQAMRKVTTRVITATQEVPTGPGGTIP